MNFVSDLISQDFGLLASQTLKTRERKLFQNWLACRLFSEWFLFQFWGSVNRITEAFWNHGHLEPLGWRVRFNINTSIQKILIAMKHRPIRVVEQGNYHVIVVIECSGEQHPMISMLFIPYRMSEFPLSLNLPCKIT